MQWTATMLGGTRTGGNSTPAYPGGGADLAKTLMAMGFTAVEVEGHRYADGVDPTPLERGAFPDEHIGWRDRATRPPAGMPPPTGDGQDVRPAAAIAADPAPPVRTRDRAAVVTGTIVDEQVAFLHDLPPTEAEQRRREQLDDTLGKIVNPTFGPDDEGYDPDDTVWFTDGTDAAGPYVEFPCSGDYHAWHGGDGDGGEADIALTRAELEQLATTIGVDLLRERARDVEAADPAAALLIDSILSVGPRKGLYFGDDPDGEIEENARYFDWSSIRNGATVFEFGSAGQAVQFEMPPGGLARLHAQITRTLLKGD